MHNQNPLQRPPASALDQRIGARIRHRRMALHISQDKLAAMVGISTRQLECFEQGAERMPSMLLYDIAVALDAPLSELLPVPQPSPEHSSGGADPLAELQLLLPKLNARALHVLLTMAQTMTQRPEYKRAPDKD